MKKLLLALSLVIWSQSVIAADKSQYHLFNPTPKESMRELSADRPDKTESPISVDAGHFQFETDLITLTRNESDGTVDLGYGIGVINAKAGLTSFSDLQLVIESFQYSSSETGGVKTSDSGFGNLTPRLKINFIGNDGGEIAAGMLLYVTIPTAKNTPEPLNHLQGGVSFPVAFSLPNEFSLGTMVTLNRAMIDDQGTYATEFTSMASVGHDLAEDWGAYLEFFNTISSDSNTKWLSTLDAGVTWSLNADTLLDAGVNLGLTENADDLNPFLGLTLRI